MTAAAPAPAPAPAPATAPATAPAVGAQDASASRPPGKLIFSHLFFAQLTFSFTDYMRVTYKR
jgi:hypothetical protein